VSPFYIEPLKIPRHPSTCSESTLATTPFYECIHFHTEPLPRLKLRSLGLVAFGECVGNVTNLLLKPLVSSEAQNLPQSE
jgi:hypothetical protein